MRAAVIKSCCHKKRSSAKLQCPQKVFNFLGAFFMNSALIFHCSLQIAIAQ